jgi:hypothetical protein
VHTTGDGDRCGSCGGPTEDGLLSSNQGRWWGGAKLGWISGAPKLRHVVLQGEPLVESAVGGVRVPASRCPSCRLVWFRYPEG